MGNKQEACHHGEACIVSCIKKVPIFQTLSSAEIDRVGRFSKAINLKRGEVVFHEDESLNYLFVVHSGKVKISKVTDAGDEHLVRILSVGDFFGEDTLFAETKTDAFAEALEQTEVCVLRQADLEQLMLDSPHIAVKLLNEVSRRLKKTETMLHILQMPNIEQRLATMLLKLLEGGETSEIKLDIRKSDLAKQIGITAESLSRKLSLFQERGIIKLVGQRTILIKNKAALDNLILGE